MHLVKLAGVTYLAPWVCPTPVASSDIEDTSRLHRGLIPYFLCCVLLLLFWLVGFSFCFVLFCIFFCLPLKFLPLYHGHVAVYQWADCRIYCSFFFSSFLKKKKIPKHSLWKKKNGVVSGIYRPLSIWFCVTLQAYLKLYSKKNCSNRKLHRRTKSSILLNVFSTVQIFRPQADYICIHQLALATHQL